MKSLTAIANAMTIALVAALAAGNASAQGNMLEQGGQLLNKSGGISGIAGALPLDKIMELLKKQGYTNITNLMPTKSGDALQATATNSKGSLVDLLINPKTGEVLKSLLKK